MVAVEKIEPLAGEELFPEAEKMPLFWENMFAPEKIVINQGGTYSTKTESIMRCLFAFAIAYPNTIIHVVANTLTKLREDAMVVADRIYKQNPRVALFVTSYNGSNYFYSFRNGSTIHFKSYQSAAEADGAKRDILYINEARRIDWGIAELLIKRTNGKVFIDYNPVGRFWVHDKIINCPAVEKTKNGVKTLVKEYPSVRVIRSWHIHNNFISQEKHDEIENIADPEMWKAYARGLTAQLSGLVYPGMEEVPDNFLDSCNDFIWGIDLGFTNDPTVILKIGLNVGEYDYVIDAYGYAPGIPPGDMAHIMKEAGYRFGQPAYMDHHVATRLQLRQLRIVAVNAQKGGKSEESGILYLRSKRIAFTARSVKFKDEVRAHMFAPLRDGTNSNKGEHKYSHGPNAARYGIYTHAIKTGAVRKEEEETPDEQEEAA